MNRITLHTASRRILPFHWQRLYSTSSEPQTPAPPSPPPKSESPLSGHIEHVQIHTAPGVELRSHHQGQVVGGLLDFLGGRLERDVLEYWRDDAVVVNPVIEARGRAEVLAYWYVYRGMFAAIKTKRHEIVRAEEGEVDVDVDREYKLRGMFGRGARAWEGRAKVKVQLDDKGRVRRVEDHWARAIWLPKFMRRATGLILKTTVKVPAEESKV